MTYKVSVDVWPHKCDLPPVEDYTEGTYVKCTTEVQKGTWESDIRPCGKTYMASRKIFSRKPYWHDIEWSY